MKKNKVFFVGLPCSEKGLEGYFQKYYNGEAQVRPQQIFDYSLLDGISNYDLISALSIPPIESYPKVKKVFFKSKKIIIKEDFSIKMMTIVNIPVLKSFCIFINVLFYLIRISVTERKNKNKIIVLGHLSTFILIPTIIVTKITKVKVVGIVPDLPDLMAGYTKNFKNTILKLISKFTMYLSSEVDGYVLLTKYMNERVNRKNKPFIVCEGILSNDLCEIKKHKDYNFLKLKDQKYIMYAGTLHKKFGIKKLVDCFLEINYPGIELWIFGQGDYEEELIRIAKSNDKIKFLGTKPKNIIFKYEQNSLFLVNPRPTSEEFTKYSFPSKTIEYLSSGRPLLTTKLKGIPDEYNDYIYLLGDETDKEFKNNLRNILSLTNEELTEFGLKGKEFVEKNKNKFVQGEKLHNFFDLIIGG